MPGLQDVDPNGLSNTQSFIQKISKPHVFELPRGHD